MVIDFMFTSRPSTRQWSLIFLSHQNPLWGNGHWFLYIKTICKAMVIDFLLYIKTLCEATIIDFFVTSRPSAKKWSSTPLHQGPMWGNGHWFLCLHKDPLRGNGHRSLYIKTLYEAMVIDLFTSRLFARHWSLISWHQALYANGHWFLCHIKTLNEALVIDLFT